jgi:two-component sensor histidine kinase
MTDSAHVPDNLDLEMELEELRSLVAGHGEELRQRDLLMREVNHRVANSIQLATSILRMQAHQETDPHTSGQLEKASSRLSAIQHVHNRLYRSADMRTIEFSQYLHDLCGELAGSVEQEGIAPAFTVKVDCERMRLPTDHVAKLGLVINELVTNAFKHAGGAADCVINVHAEKLEGERLVVEVSDNGTGLPDGFDMARVKGLGMRLVRFVSSSLGGSSSARNGETGAVFRVEISVAPPPPLVHE